MECHYWSFPISCEKCSQPTHLQSFQFSADGELVLHTYCYDCKQVHRFSIYMERLKAVAMQNDIRDYMQGLKARKSLPKSDPNTITDEDKQFLKENHIEGDA